MDFHSPSELITGTPHRPAGLPARRTMLTLLSFGDPTTHSRGGGSVLPAADPSATACRVRGLDTPFATCTTLPTGVVHTGASMGFTLQGVPLAHDRCPSRGPCPPGVSGPRRPLPGERLPEHGRLQGLAPVASPCCRRIHEGSGRRCLPEVPPSRAFTQPTWRARWIRRLPSHPWTA
jgi:hypothetical protein